MDENNQNNAKPTIDKEYLKKLAEKIKAEKARKEALGKKSEPTPVTPPISSISSKYLDDDDEEIASEKTAIIDLSALSGHAADAKLTIVDGKDAGKNIEMTKDEILAGRSLDNDFVISDISVSRKHFKITKDGDRFIISDMGSGNGIKVNGSKTTSATLSDGDIISVGARQIKFEILNPELKPKHQAQRVTKENIQPVYDIEEDDDEPVKKGSSAGIIIAIIVVLLIGIGGVAYFMLFDNQNAPANTIETPKTPDNSVKDVKEEVKNEPKTEPVKIEDTKKEEPAAEPKEEVKEAPQKEEPKAEPKKEEPKAEPKEEVKEAPKKEEPKAESKKETPKKAEAKKEEPKAESKKEEVKEAPQKEEPKAEPKKEEPKKETKKAEPKPAPEKKAKKATMSEQEAKKLYMEARMMRDEDPEEAKKKLQKIINSVDPESKHYKKAKELLEKL